MAKRSGSLGRWIAGTDQDRAGCMGQVRPDGVTGADINYKKGAGQDAAGRTAAES